MAIIPTVKCRDMARSIAFYSQVLDFEVRGVWPAQGNPDSPVHQGPLDQTWGTREFYVDDPEVHRPGAVT